MTKTSTSNKICQAALGIAAIATSTAAFASLEPADRGPLVDLEPVARNTARDYGSTPEMVSAYLTENGASVAGAAIHSFGILRADDIELSHNSDGKVTFWQPISIESAVSGEADLRILVPERNPYDDSLSVNSQFNGKRVQIEGTIKFRSDGQMYLANTSIR